ncbi:hypothetical protein Ddye_004230 [Dipteronia dyeriana]|uniref:O-methyltransferase n=1 Tax=Dipteronia dyeriana TaxID=168575 RepID=A0AAD9XTS8_9ROSI|nr:hypothetical protein Ddye_004230 [Dipteronia dyeriana]
MERQSQIGETKRRVKTRDEEEEEKAEVEIWEYTFGFVKMAVVKCAIELGIADAVENHGGPMTLSELSSTLSCSPSSLSRIMRFLVHYRIFREVPASHGGTTAFEHTPISRRLISQVQTSMAAFILLESSPVMLAPWHNLSAQARIDGAPFMAEHGKDVWDYAAVDGAHSKLINDAMACGARAAVPAVIEGCPEVFDGVGSLVDVGGGNGTTLRLLVQALPSIKGINFDLPHVVSVAEDCDGVEHVGGDFFNSVPEADAAFLMWVLHDWSDEECIQILKKCREAVPKDKGKVIIVDAIVGDEHGASHGKFEFVRLMLDMVMMAHTTNGKERTLKEWDYVLKQAGFSSYNIKPIKAVPSVIEAFP